MDVCVFCGEKIEQTNGKRKKEFCNNTCRSNAWYGKNKKGKVVVKNHTQPDKPKDYTKKAAKNESINNYPIGIFERLLAQAKSKTLNIDELDRAKLTMNQKDLILRKYQS